MSEGNEPAIPRKRSRQSLTREPPTEFLLHFIELPPFSRRWEQLHLNIETDLAALQFMIMANPKVGAVIGGTNGIRKLRFAPASWKSGKSGGTRVLYIYFAEFGVVLLCLIYAKGEVDSISEAVKKYLNQLVIDTERELRRISGLSAPQGR